MRIKLVGVLLALTVSAAKPPQSAQAAQKDTVRISVLSLFHPKSLVLASTRPLTLTLDSQTITLPPSQPATLTSLGETLTLTTASAEAISTTSLTLPDSSFTLTVPGKLTRFYRAALSVTVTHGALQPILTIPTELAVASIVTAEAPPHAPLEALKAQAVVSRSFLLANTHGHPNFDACDTTHCQFLRSPPPPSSPAARATRATQNQVLTWRAAPESLPQVVAAMYSRSCGGRTRPHPTTPDRYPYYAVPCAYCLRHPERWTRPATRAPTTEQQRLAYNRTHGWSAIPSNNSTATPHALEGTGTGHGIGLCQLGAADLAAHGTPYPQILAHYFPNTNLTRLDSAR
jgi:stage II sporulation protein D